MDCKSPKVHTETEAYRTLPAAAILVGGRRRPMWLPAASKRVA
jgi:hypothetical protein